MATFKDRFKELRKEKDLTQKGIGDILGYSESNISLYESGGREPKTIEDLIKIADFFEVSLDYLMGRTNDRNILLINDEVNGDKIEIGVDKRIYPDGLTHEQVIEILENFKKMGFNYTPETDKK
jgi:transcriptional regulator with XRE-family HTH domain